MMWKKNNNCIDCEKTLVNGYADRCHSCAAKKRVSDPNIIKKISQTMKDKVPKNFVKMLKDTLGNRKGSKHSFETRKKMSDAHRGSKSYLWKGGITTVNNLIRRNVDYRAWREKVFKRDDYTCQVCGIRGAFLQADHIKPFAYFPELRFELSNGRTLCLECHKMTDTYLGRAKRFEKQTQ